MITQSVPHRSQNNKLIGLEVIRFLAAFAVLLWHYQHFSFIADKANDFERQLQPFYNQFRIFYDYGYLGVQVFWSISGFIFFYKYSDSVANKKIAARRFIVLRFSRLYPLHIATLALVAILQIA